MSVNSGPNYVVFRYRCSKPTNGHLSFQLHAGAHILSYAEHWHSDDGWQVVLDALEDTHQAKEARHFFLCNAGDNLTFLGDFPEAYYVGMHDSKSYCSYLFETSHLSDLDRARGMVQPRRYARPKPGLDELSRTGKRFEHERQERRAAPSSGAQAMETAVGVQEAVAQLRAVSE